VVRLKSRRKKTYINRRVQGRIIGRVAAYWILYHFVLWHGLFVYRYAQHRVAVAGGENALPFRQLYADFCASYSPLLFCAALILPLFMVDFVRMTHRVVGPLVRVRNALQQLMAGERVPSVEFRKGDLITEFESEFNEFLAFYDGQTHRAQTGAAVLTEHQADLVQDVVATEQPAEHECAPACP
jgi:hypothetical protein